MSSTRFYDRTSGECGPVIGAYQVVPVVFDAAIAATDDISKQFKMPPGSSFRVTDAVVYAGTIVGTAIVSIGTTADGTDVSKTTLTAAAGVTETVMTVKTYTPSTSGLVEVRVLAGAGETVALPFSVTLGGYVSAEPTSTAKR